MKFKMSYKSKRLAIIAVVIIVLIIAISIGIYYFIKSNSSAQAVYLENEQNLTITNDDQSEMTKEENEQINQTEEATNTNEEDIQENTDIDESTEENNAEENDTEQNDTEENDAEENTDNTTSTSATTTVSTTYNEYAQTDIIEIEVEKVDREVNVGWTNIELGTAKISINIETSEPNIEEPDTEEPDTEEPETENKIITVIPTVESSVPQRAILVLDFSSSMANKERIDELKVAVKLFLEEFLQPDENGDATTGNEVIIIEYDKNIINNTPMGPYTNINDLDISGHSTGSGTNIDLALTEAYEYLTNYAEDGKSTSVILMSDGVPYQYSTEDGTIIKDSDQAKIEAIESANKIKEEGTRLFTIGFKMAENGAELMQEIATSNETFYSADNDGDLERAFQEISRTIKNINDIDSITYTITSDGIVYITDGFEEGQNVEIYAGETYVSNTTSPYKTYSWDEFIGLEGYVTYSDSDNTITFNIQKYMEDNNIDANASITIRFSAGENNNTLTESEDLSSTYEIDENETTKVQDELVENVQEVIEEVEIIEEETIDKEEGLITETENVVSEDDVITPNETESDINNVVKKEEDEEEEVVQYMEEIQE